MDSILGGVYLLGSTCVKSWLSTTFMPVYTTFLPSWFLTPGSCQGNGVLGQVCWMEDMAVGTFGVLTQRRAQAVTTLSISEETMLARQSNSFSTPLGMGAPYLGGEGRYSAETAF